MNRREELEELLANAPQEQYAAGMILLEMACSIQTLLNDISLSLQRIADAYEEAHK